MAAIKINRLDRQMIEDAKEAKRQYMREYRQANKERIKQQQTAYWARKAQEQRTEKEGRPDG